MGRFYRVALVAGFVVAGAAPALAIGCLSGGAAGAVAGHVAHHHAVLGAAGGCLVGHEMNKHDKKKAQEQAIQAGQQHPN